MTEKLIEIIEYGSESASVDFKGQEYPLGKDAPNKNELLKDVCAMVNHPSDEPKYIIIGVREKKDGGTEVVGVETPTDQAKYQQFINSTLEPGINFEYRTFEYDGRTLAAFIIVGNQQRPYLFKKEVQRPTDKKVEYREGDGFIRTGTSTRKLIRKDLEHIYAKRQEARDRKSDLEITPYFKKIDRFGVFRFGSFTIDFAIENLSGKSIGFDAELRLSIEKEAFVTNAFKYLEKTGKSEGLGAIYPQYFPDKSDEMPQYVEIEKRNDYYKVVRIKEGSGRYAVSIPQKDTNDYIFSTDVLVNIPGAILNYRDTLVTAQLLLRSDDFKEGPIVRGFKFEVKGYGR